ITFDDGYNEKAIKKVLEVSKTYDVKLTFFIVGALLEEYPELWKEAVEDGHEICNHTYGHCDLNKLSSGEVKNQILKWEIAAEKVLGSEYVNKMKNDYPYIRLPFGSGSSSKRIMQIISEAGYIPVGWAVETCYAVLRHYNLKRADIEDVSAEVSRHITSTTKPGRIVLLHFNSYDTYKLDEIFRQIIDLGYEIKPLSMVLE
ncbi:MAG: polysaccharide deacetylase family protein, partial [Eubacteriales bacterium]|nr:polysaccharide deacetylase family protein [Eubacteriales bacterium]